MDPITQIILAVLGSICTSSWIGVVIVKRMDRKYAKNDRDDDMKKMILGIGYAMIMDQGSKYICRGWITKEELKYFREYLYEPYKALGGDGAGDKMMSDVENLPQREVSFTDRKEVCNL